MVVSVLNFSHTFWIILIMCGLWLTETTWPVAPNRGCAASQGAIYNIQWCESWYTFQYIIKNAFSKCHQTPKQLLWLCHWVSQIIFL